MTIKITTGTVVTANSRMEVWQPGYVIVRDGRIAEAGPGPGPDGDFEERIDARSSIVMPGLVNGHSHSPSNSAQGYMVAAAARDMASIHSSGVARIFGRSDLRQRSARHRRDDPNRLHERDGSTSTRDRRCRTWAL